MLYFSELKNKDVCTEDNVKVGILEDLIFSATEIPTVSKLVINNLIGSKINVPVKYLKKINDYVVIKKDYTVAELEENELYLLRNIQDKQIIDLQGNKIVRVNDVVIQDKAGLYIAGVDIGIFGVLRWLKLENLFNRIVTKLHIKFVSQFLSWGDIQPLELARGQVRLKKEEKKLEKLRPEDLADYLEKTNIVNVRKILRMLDEKFAAQVIGSLNINFQSSLFKQFAIEKAAKIVELIDPDDAVDILLTVSQKKRKEILFLLEDNKKRKILHLLEHSYSAIGEVMRTDFLTVSPGDSVRNVIEKIKKETADYYYFNIVYVVNNSNQLIGIFNLHTLLMQDLNMPIYKFMIQNIIVVHITTPKEIAIKRILKYRLYSLPVVDENKVILGIITLGDLLT